MQLKRGRILEVYMDGDFSGNWYLMLTFYPDTEKSWNGSIISYKG